MIDSPNIVQENEHLRFKCHELSNELASMKEIFHKMKQPNNETVNEKFYTSQQFNNESKFINPILSQSATTPKFSDITNSKKSYLGKEINKKESELILELFSAGDLQNAAEK